MVLWVSPILEVLGMRLAGNTGHLGIWQATWWLTCHISCPRTAIFYDNSNCGPRFFITHCDTLKRHPSIHPFRICLRSICHPSITCKLCAHRNLFWRVCCVIVITQTSEDYHHVAIIYGGGRKLQSCDAPICSLTRVVFWMWWLCLHTNGTPTHHHTNTTTIIYI